MVTSRNDPCPCGSGAKYKRCCLSAAQESKRVELLEGQVGDNIAEWAGSALVSEYTAAFDAFCEGRTPAQRGSRSMSETEVELFSAWFHSDRRLPDGLTPAERYAQRPGLDARERAVAQRIASAQLGLYRVLEVLEGDSMLLEDLVSSERTGVASANISRDAVRWDLLIGRVMHGNPSGLWAATRLLKPSEESDLLAEIARLGGVTGSPNAATIARVLRSHPLEIFRFRTPVPDGARSFFTVEGDPVAEASAVWEVDDQIELDRRLRRLGGIGAGEEPVIDITAPRDTLVRDRSHLPKGAVILEHANSEDLASVPFATVRLTAGRLTLEAMSKERLKRAVDIVEGDFGDLIGRRDVDVVPIEQRLAERAEAPQALEPETESGLDAGLERELLEDFLTDRMRRWVDDPNAHLGGLSPREAVVGEQRSAVIALVRTMENGADRARRAGDPSADLSWLPHELGIESHLAA